MKYYCVKQHDITDCGAACLATIAKQNGYRLSISKIREIAGTDKQGKEIPEPPAGVLYKGMGVQENQNCTVITLRMKNRRMRWSVKGANNLAKVLYRKESKELIETMERYTDGLIFTLQMQELVETLSAAKAPKKDGKGNSYVGVISAHMPLLEAMQTALRKSFKRAFCI